MDIGYVLYVWSSMFVGMCVCNVVSVWSVCVGSWICYPMLGPSGRVNVRMGESDCTGQMAL